MSSLFRLISLLAAVFALSACEVPDPTTEPQVDMGNFSLGHNVVFSDKAAVGPLSRTADEGTWEEILKDEIDKRFGGYEGAKLYHLGISVEGYVLAVPGVPFVASPKSILIINVTAWDDAAGGKLNEEPKQITVLERISGETVVGSGLTQKKEQQQRNLARNAARAVQKWLLQNPEWFDIAADEAAAAAAGLETGEVDADALLAEQETADAAAGEAEAAAN